VAVAKQGREKVWVYVARYYSRYRSDARLSKGEACLCRNEGS
jgi:hypothetical protein